MQVRATESHIYSRQVALSSEVARGRSAKPSAQTQIGDLVGCAGKLLNHLVKNYPSACDWQIATQVGARDFGKIKEPFANAPKRSERMPSVDIWTVRLRS